MDSKQGVQHGGHHSHHNGISKPPVHHHHHARRRSGAGSARQAGGKGIKVVYISSPMKLTASAEEFGAIVQELTGRDSNVADHDLDLDGGAGAYYAAGATSSSSYSYSSFGRVSPTAAAEAAAAAGGGRALSPTVMVAATNAGPVRRAPAVEYAAAMAEPPPFHDMYDQTAGTLLYGQNYW